MNNMKDALPRIAITGAAGRMGRMLIEAVLNDPTLCLCAAFEHENSPFIGQDVGMVLGKNTGVLIQSDIEKMLPLAKANVLIDFTRPEGTLHHLQLCQKTNTAIVIGTTGFDAAGKAAITQAAKNIPIVFAPNMSVGVNVTLKLIEMATQYLHNDYDIEIYEAHHKHKVDAPSGTALGMGEAVARAMNRSLDDVAQWARHGHTGERKQGDVGFSVMRGGDIVGDHTVFFAGLGERIEITHRSSSRANYAAGSLKAAKFLAAKIEAGRHFGLAAFGLFDMQAVLGLDVKTETAMSQ